MLYQRNQESDLRKTTTKEMRKVKRFAVDKVKEDV